MVQNVPVHFAEGDLVCGVDVRSAQEAIRSVGKSGWTSAGVVAEAASCTRDEAEELLHTMHAEGFVADPHHGPVPKGHDGRWLDEEEPLATSLLLWHQKSKGKALEKAPIGPPLAPGEADAIIESIIRRCEDVNANSRSSHVVDQVTLYGSVCSEAPEVWDVDVAIVAHLRMAEGADSSLRGQLEGWFRKLHDRADVVVQDETWPDGDVIPEGAMRREIFPPIP
jgi:hypothetical protein